ncbi:MAG: YggS family pyridoxal phosphate-dependent enzyme [Terrimicrobiaceae bacterium]|nr:YggS family pyridoxal phosphate-dependent enzyme [Terrimicrobiaceae bacterium]
MSEVEQNLAEVRERIAAAAARAGRSADDVGLIAVSKTFPAEAVREAWEAGQSVFGESRVQESVAKIAELPGALRWHFIGHMQKNKVRRALPLFELFHGIDSLDLAQAMDRIAAEDGLFPRVLIEVNVAGEAAKFGLRPEALDRDLDALLALPRLQIEGLMTIAPYAEEPEASRPHFRSLRELRDRLAAHTGLPFGTLSMGMSGDFAVAVEEGATLVRVGTAIFGSRGKGL